MNHSKISISSSFYWLTFYADKFCRCTFMHEHSIKIILIPFIWSWQCGSNHIFLVHFLHTIQRFQVNVEPFENINLRWLAVPCWQRSQCVSWRHYVQWSISDPVPFYCKFNFRLNSIAFCGVLITSLGETSSRYFLKASSSIDCHCM